MTSKIRLSLPNTHAKVIEYKGKEYTIPKITLYHRQFLTEDVEGLSNHEIVLPVVEKMIKCDDISLSEDYEYLTIKLLEHNKALNKMTVIDGEVFLLEDMVLCGKNEFEYDGRKYKFRKPTAYESYDSYLDGMNALYEGEDEIDFNEMPSIFFRYAFMLFGTVKVVGSRGGVLNGLESIIDNFFCEQEFIKLRG